MSPIGSSRSFCLFVSCEYGQLQSLTPVLPFLLSVIITKTSNSVILVKKHNNLGVPFISLEELFLTCGVETSEMSCISISVIMLQTLPANLFLLGKIIDAYKFIISQEVPTVHFILRPWCHSVCPCLTKGVIVNYFSSTVQLCLGVEVLTSL